ncbi:hypothetical protein ABRQ22_16765 [Cellulosimicrobium sp. ES-005]|uniref:DUF732 domain-containing protein n=1 Tax=Cellulosimicrobium sp. ES-005 TaxID=3163031 RepID=A0AAU8FYL9_9MICO
MEDESNRAGDARDRTDGAGEGEKRRKLRVRRGDGEWKEIEPAPPIDIDDPEIAAIGLLKQEDVAAIIENKDDPRHAAALEYERLRGLRNKRWAARIGEALGASPSAAAKSVLDSLGEAARGSVDLAALAYPTPPMAPITGAGEGSRLLDLEPVHNPTYDVLVEQQKANGLASDANEILSGMADLARDEANAARKDASDAARKTRHALVAAWVAVGVTVVVGAVQVAVALNPPQMSATDPSLANEATPSPESVQPETPLPEPSAPYSDPATWTDAEKRAVQELRSGLPGVDPHFSDEQAAEFLRFGHLACDSLTAGEGWRDIATQFPSLPQQEVLPVIGEMWAELCPEVPFDPR